jgi:hypothetical protein
MATRHPFIVQDYRSKLESLIAGATSFADEPPFLGTIEGLDSESLRGRQLKVGSWRDERLAAIGGPILRLASDQPSLSR